MKTKIKYSATEAIAAEIAKQCDLPYSKSFFDKYYSVILLQLHKAIIAHYAKFNRASPSYVCIGSLYQQPTEQYKEKYVMVYLINNEQSFANVDTYSSEQLFQTKELPRFKLNTDKVIESLVKQIKNEIEAVEGIEETEESEETEENEAGPAAEVLRKNQRQVYKARMLFFAEVSKQTQFTDLSTEDKAMFTGLPVSDTAITSLAIS